MGEGNSISLLDLGPLSKPANTLIKKISGAVGGLCEPWQTRRVADAKADALIRAAEAEIEVSDLHRRALRRRFEEEAIHQRNMESITAKAILMLEDSTDPEIVEDDWLSHFFDDARRVSDDEMQGLWARVLAGEANSPGSFSKRTISLLRLLSREEAEAFRALRRFAWQFEVPICMVFGRPDEFYYDYGLSFTKMTHLDSIGLVRFDAGTVHTMDVEPVDGFVFADYGDSRIRIRVPTEYPCIPVGCLFFTGMGEELATICELEPVDGFIEHVIQCMALHGRGGDLAVETIDK